MRNLLLMLCLVVVAAFCLGAGEPATGPSKEAAERAAGLRKDIKEFSLSMAYAGEQDKPFYSLTLVVQPLVFKTPPAANDLYVQINEEQANKVIDFLLADGALGRAHLPEPGGMLPGPRYGWVINGQFNEDLGWKLPMLAHFDGLRKVLEGEAAKKMDVLLERLSGLRKEWEAAARRAFLCLFEEQRMDMGGLRSPLNAPRPYTAVMSELFIPSLGLAVREGCQIVRASPARYAAGGVEVHLSDKDLQDIKDAYAAQAKIAETLTRATTPATQPATGVPVAP